MKKYETGLAPRKISMIDGPSRLGSEYTSPEIQFSKERFAISRLTASTAAERTSPVTAEKPPAMSMSRRMRARGRSARGMNRTSPLSSPRMPIDVAKEDSETRDPAIPTAFALNNRAAKAQKTNPREEFANAATRTQPPCSRTIAESSIGPVDTVGSTQGNSQPVITPTNIGRDGEAIRLPRSGDFESTSNRVPSFVEIRTGRTLPGMHPVPSSSANPNTDDALPFLIVRSLHRAAAEVPAPPRTGGGGAEGEASGRGHGPPARRRARARGPAWGTQETRRGSVVRPGRPPRRTASRGGRHLAEHRDSRDPRGSRDRPERPRGGPRPHGSSGSGQQAGVAHRAVRGDRDRPARGEPRSRDDVRILDAPRGVAGDPA